ncbi:hypothetical protein MAIT1_00775 [Magnetofaba australis IT-1]|uniref:ATP-grasp domain-containing protein n=2 Tax=Magnetofaba TaxID=1472292 RepID=A0A1Y2JZF2_9PROT|nr:hypothetical protein MAIT1_00775 [Magnetofaba australis IT-1]
MNVKYIDIETFIGSPSVALKNIDYSVNLICGNKNISLWALVPSISYWYNVIPMPNRTEAMIAGERKDTANLIATKVGFSCPEWATDIGDLDQSIRTIVKKPRDYGSSSGLEIGEIRDFKDHKKNDIEYIYQEFVEGIDVTIPILYSDIHKTYLCGHGVAFIPDADAAWVLDSGAKSINRVGIVPESITKVYYTVPKEIVNKINKLMIFLGNSSVGRIDFRVRLKPSSTIYDATLDEYNFIEINPTPTMNAKSDFVGGIESALADSESEIYSYAVETTAETGVDMSRPCSIVAYTMLKYAEITSNGNE